MEDPQAFLDAARSPLPPVVWANELRLPRPELEEFFHQPPATGQALPVEPLPWLPGAYRLPLKTSSGNRFEYVSGLYHVQEEVSLLPVTLLAPQPGERVLDLCAAPGGKTAQLAVAVGLGGTVVANDKYFGRLSVLRRLIDRLGLPHCVLTQHDAAGYPREAGLFDRVLADVPCSCEGNTRKMPHLLEGKDVMPPGHLADLQGAILRRAVELCRPGGRIAYATCTYAPEENEAVVDDALRRYAGCLRLLPARLPGFRSAPGLTAWRGRAFHQDMEHCLRAWPHLQDTGGFFVALLEKTGPTGSPKEGRADAETSLQQGARVLPESEAEALRQRVDEYHRFRDAPLEDFAYFSPNNRFLSYTTPSLRLPTAPRPHSIGLPFIHHGTTDPRLASSASMHLAPFATHNVVDLSAPQADAFFHRQTFHDLLPHQRHHTTSGFTLLRYRGVGLGTGVLQPGESEQDPASVRSLFPKGWALREGRRAFTAD